MYLKSFLKTWLLYKVILVLTYRALPTFEMFMKKLFSTDAKNHYFCFKVKSV